MTLSCTHRDGPHRAGQIYVRRLRAIARAASSRTSAAFKIIHQAIVTAKTRRLERELTFHADSSDNWSVAESVTEGHDAHRDAARFPQRPLILDDKWDF
jgi:hypothetical protein